MEKFAKSQMNYARMIAFSCLAFLALELPAQNVGVNTNDPLTALDIDGQLRIRPSTVAVSSSMVAIPANNKGYYSLIGSSPLGFAVNLPTAVPGGLLVISNETLETATALGNVRIRPGTARMFLAGPSGWIQAHETPSELEKITEGANTGWRLLGSNPSNYGNIGQNAVDLSTSTLVGSNYGATGENSLAAGFGTLASGEYAVSMGIASTSTGQASTAFGYLTRATANGAFATGWGSESRGFASAALNESTLARGDGSLAGGRGTVARSYLSVALGRFNDSTVLSNLTAWVATDPLFVLGNGSSDANRSNALVIYKNGNADLNGFTRLGSALDGAPRIKTKRLSGTLNGVGNATIAHGVTTGKILGLEARVTNQFGSLVFGGNTIPNNSFNAFVSGPSVSINAVAGSNGDIINQAFTILLTYEE